MAPTKKLLRVENSALGCQMKRLIATWNFYRALWGQEFLSALAEWKKGAIISRAASFRAQHRLGLYATLAARAAKEDLPGQWRAILAVAVSCSAVGARETAKTYLAYLSAAAESKPKRRHLIAAALAPHDPLLALAWLEKDGPCTDRCYPDLLVALLEAAGAETRAASLLEEALARDLQEKHPELLLHAANLTLAGFLAADDAQATAQARLNTFLEWHGLESLVRRDLRQPLACWNVASAPVVSGLEDHEVPLVSVIMTGYRTARRIGPALESLRSQTHRNLEIIVVDDASDDDLGEAVQAAAQGDPRVLYYRLPRNVGPYVAKDLALRELTKGDFVTCHDSDDWSHPRKIELQLKPLLQDPAKVFTWSHWLRLSDEGRIQVRQCHPLLRPNLSSLLFRREAVLSRAGGYDAVRTGADSEFLARLQVVFGRKAGLRLRKPLALGAVRDDSLTHSAETGTTEGGITASRLQYWEAWRAWHLGCLMRGELPFMPPPGSPRPFPTSEAQHAEAGDDLVAAVKEGSAYLEAAE